MQPGIGVQYTPRSLVDYGIEQTLGLLLRDRTLQFTADGQIQWPEFTVLDPACGDGAFLLGAYDYLVQWYSQQYAQLPHRPALTDADHGRILSRHIYGVEFDANVAAIARQNLLNHCRHHTVTPVAIADLPNLHSNIQSGNALISLNPTSPPPATRHQRPSPFSWQTHFPHILQQGGFDVVIGNPPYVDAEAMTTHLSDWRRYCQEHYRSASGNWDLFCVFIEQALNLCRVGGYVSLVVPNKLGSASYAATTRQVLLEGNTLLALRDYSQVPVFPVAVYPLVFVVQRGVPQAHTPVCYQRMVAPAAGSTDPAMPPSDPLLSQPVLTQRLLSQQIVTQALDCQRYFHPPQQPWPIFADLQGQELVMRLRQRWPALGAIAQVLGGATVAEAYAIQPLITDCPNAPAQFDATVAPVVAPKVAPVVAPLRLVNSGTVDRYRVLWGVKPMRYLGQIYQHPILEPEQESQLPAKRRQQARSPKLIVASMTRQLEVAMDSSGAWLAAKSTTIVMVNPGLGTHSSPTQPPRSPLDLRYLLALLNSRLLSFYYTVVFGGDRLNGGYLRIGPPQLRTLPIALVEQDDPSRNQRHAEWQEWRSRYDQIIAEVDQILDWSDQWVDQPDPKQQQRLQQAIERSDQRIEALVGQVYGLSPAEMEQVAKLGTGLN